MVIEILALRSQAARARTIAPATIRTSPVFAETLVERQQLLACDLAGNTGNPDKVHDASDANQDAVRELTQRKSPARRPLIVAYRKLRTLLSRFPDMVVRVIDYLALTHWSEREQRIIEKKKLEEFNQASDGCA